MSTVSSAPLPADLCNPAVVLPAAPARRFADALGVFTANPGRFWGPRGAFEFGALTEALAAELELDACDAALLMLRVVSLHNLLVSNPAIAEICADMLDRDALSEFAIGVAASMPLKPWSTAPTRPMFDPAAFQAAMRRAMH